MSQKISIIIPNWNGKEKLEKHLPDVLKVKDIEEIIVVDDASTDESVKFLKENYQEKIKLIEKDKNTGFGSNVNLGVKNSIGDLVFLLNTDAAPEVNCLENVLAHFQDPQVFSVGFNTGGNWSWAKWEKGWFWHFQSSAKVQTHETLWASGGAGVFRKSIWEELNGFDPLFDPFYVEDVDLGFRAWKRGYLNIWEENAKVEHYKEVGVIAQNFKSEKIQNTSERNMLIFIWKNIHDPALINQHIFALIKRLITSPKFWPIFLQALFLLPDILKKRKLEKKNSKLTDKQVLGKFG